LVGKKKAEESRKRKKKKKKTGGCNRNENNSVKNKASPKAKNGQGQKTPQVRTSPAANRRWEKQQKAGGRKRSLLLAM